MALSEKDKWGCKHWEEEENLKAWLQPVAGDKDKVTCPFCKCTMHGDFADVWQRMATAEHQKCTPLSCSLPVAEDGLNALKQPAAAPIMSMGTEVGGSSVNSLEIKREEMNKAALGSGPGNAAEAFRFSAEPTLENIRKLQTAFTAERGWGKYHQPRNLLLALVGEVGELAELFQWREEAPEGLPGWTDPEREALSDELSDVLIYLVALADKCHVDLPSAALRKIEKNRLKYPAERVYGSSKKYTEYQQ